MKFFLGIFCLALLFASGCAPKWAVNYETPDMEIQWPYPPAKPVVKHQKNIKGFRETEAVTLKSIIHGREEIIIQRPSAIAVGDDGRFAIADTECMCVHLYMPSEQKYIMITTAKNDELNSPVGLVFDEEFRLYVSDSALGGVFVYDAKGEFLHSIKNFNGIKLKRPTGVAYNTRKKLLYIIDTLEHRFYAVNKEGRIVFFRGSRGEGDGDFNFPTHAFWSDRDMLYITDSMNFRVQAFGSDGKFMFRFGQHGNGSGDFAMPRGVAADMDGVIYVVDSLFDNVQLFDENGEFLLTVGGRGYFHGEFWLPSGMFVDNKSNTLYVCDTYNRRVQVFQIMRNRL